MNYANVHDSSSSLVLGSELSSAGIAPGLEYLLKSSVAAGDSVVEEPSSMTEKPGENIVSVQDNKKAVTIDSTYSDLLT